MECGKNKKLKFQPWKEAESFLHLINLRLTYDAFNGNELKLKNWDSFPN